ncbi:MAG: DUF72 domain-containing protein [Myxococcaceae bacterium]|jgi:uncharacterized protein YecE (DUF72 family)|nr:DUF72 domain-containing protein [Myxococcaceae bacterium]MCA3015941.1 DUF72 domain-containing protein [Myxococcaceae bacterium]
MQLSLFPPPPLDLRADEALARARPPHLFIGTSSWTFPGWKGLVYPGEPSLPDLVARGLETYARHPLFNTVGIDRSYYAPLSRDELVGYARQLPPGFRCVMKVWSRVCSLVDPRTRAPNPDFLDARRFCDQVLEPALATFSEHLGPLVFQLLPLSRSELLTPDVFVAKLGRFLAELPRGPSYAVELRNPEWLTPAYLELLARHGVAHVFNHWERMPSLDEQLARPGAFSAPFTVCRLLLPQGVGYEAAREAFAPFDRLQARDDAMRAAVRTLVDRAGASGRQAWVIVNNKVEGSSPLTVRGILETLKSPARG